MGEALAGPFYRAPRTRAAELVVAGSLGGFAKAAQERFREKFRAPAAFETPYYLPSRIPTTYVCLSLFALQSGQIASGQNPPLPRCAHDGRHRAAAACQKADAPRAAKCKSFVTPCYLKVSAAKWIDCQLVK